jgi:predicted dienelactone hydrolase
VASGAITSSNFKGGWRLNWHQVFMNSPASAPSVPGPFAVRTHTFEARDLARDRLFPCDIWCPDEPGARPLVLFSHHSRGNRRSATYLTAHLASHGYFVAALDHSEVVAPELAGNAQGFIANRVPDAHFLLDYLLAGAIPCSARPDPDRIAIVGHSIGGWTALALPETDTRIRAVVALAPGGASNPKPGIIPAALSFNWPRPPATLYIVAEDDVLTPIAGMHELYSRTPGPKQMVGLRDADHLHFVDNVEQSHEQLRAASFPPEASWISREMRPIAELCSGKEAHRQIQSHTLAHLNAALSPH